MSNPVIKTTLKKDGSKIEVYKLRDGKYNRFLGDKLTVQKLDAKEHLQVFDASELELPKNN